MGDNFLQQAKDALDTAQRTGNAPAQRAAAAALIAIAEELAKMNEAREQEEAYRLFTPGN